MTLTLGTLHCIWILNFVEYAIHELCIALSWNLEFGNSRVELVVQFPARDSTQVLLCIFPGVLWL